MHTCVNEFVIWRSQNESSYLFRTLCVFFDVILNKNIRIKHHFSKRMSESSTPPKVSLYEKFRSFTVKHLAPINTLVLLGATFGGGQLLDRLGLLPLRTSVEAQRLVTKSDEHFSKPSAVTDTASLPPPLSSTPIPAVTESRSSVPVRQQKSTDDAVRTLNKQLDDERLKHANAILDATLK